jgi:hypothetical protein
MGRALDGVTRGVDRLLGRYAGLVPPERRGWAEAVRAEAGEVPPGPARLGWLAGGFWLVAREAGMVRRMVYGLGVAAVAVAAALTVRYLWSGAHAGRDAWWDKARILLLVALLVGLPWVARHRGVFGPVGRSVAARAIRAGGSAALVALVLDFARVEHYRGPSSPDVFHAAAGAWSWALETVAVALIAACLAAVWVVPAWWPRARPMLVAWCAVPVALVLFFTLAPLQVLIAVYVAGILAVTSRRSPVTPATLAISAGTGVGGGLLIVALWNPLHSNGPGQSTAPRPILLFMLLVGVTGAGTVAAGKIAAWRAARTNGPMAPQARAWQYLAAGPLTAASAALMLPLLRASAATHFAAICPATKVFLCTSAPAIWTFFLVAGPIIGLAIGSGCAGAITTGQPPTQPPSQPPPEPPSDRSRAGGVFVKI